MKKINDNPNARSCESQVSRILAYLLTGRGITPLDALRMFGCFRLGARIAQLKGFGYDIRTEMVKDAETGKRFARYSLNSSDDKRL